MAEKKRPQSVGKRIWSNYVVRNVIWAISLLVIIAVVASILLNIFTRHGSGLAVPDFTGSTFAEAQRVAEANKLNLEIGDSIYVTAYPAGAILDQNPKAGDTVKSGRRVFVTINTASRRQVIVPYIVGLSLRQAKSRLESAGFEIANLEYVSDVATNTVLGEWLNGREIVDGDRYRAPMGSAITLQLGRSTGASPAVMPNVVGLSLAAAKSRLWGEGLNIGRIDRREGVNLLTIQRAKVVSQSVTAESQVALGTSINLVISL